MKMSKAVLISIKPKWVEKIMSGEKTIEVRHTAPKEVPFKCYIYCCKDNAQEIVLLKDCKNRFSFGDYRNADGHFYDVANRTVIGEFICDKVYNLVNAFGGIVFADENLNQLDPQLFRNMSCLTDEQTADYLGNKDGYGWHISDLKIYDKPKALSEFKTPPCEKPEKACGTCKYHVVINTPDMYEVDCFVANGREISRPPQSYMFVEEI